MPRLKPFLRAALCLLSAVLPFACQGQTISVVSGNNQTTIINTNFPQPLVVNTSAPAGQTVMFSGSGIVTTSATTDAQGQASAVVQANGNLGASTVSATVQYNVSPCPIELNCNSSTEYVATTIFTLNNSDAPCSPSIAVSSTRDSGSGSLREALADVCPGGTVDLSGLPTPANISLQTRLYLNQNVRIVGRESGTVVISGGRLTRIFFMEGGNATISNETWQTALAAPAEAVQAWAEQSSKMAAH